MKPVKELPSVKCNEDPNTEKRKQEILDFLASGAEFCELEMFGDNPKNMLASVERGKYERAIRILAPQTGYGKAYARGKHGLRLYQRNYKLYCQRCEGGKL